ncbi:MotA/TolQ/ExbB proton channel family protein [Granulosicoccus sp. 3-233]|uniref:MotA/TolQ/ExbB proton channel family protein n=1 Tax=Granulosicoccus sp. 3-233 TaxID=3417969 RepID=UPI003D33BD7D
MNRHRASQSAHQYPHLQVWLLLISLTGFGVYVLHDLRYLSLVVSLDRSFMASLTLTLLLIATAHCGWHVALLSSHIAQLQRWLNDSVSRDDDVCLASGPSASFLRTWFEDLQDIPVTADASVRDGLVEITAERFRSIVDLGWFFVDLSIRLGLLGTIIGFMLIFASLTDISIEGGDELQTLLIAMSGGMGTALLTTLTGLVTASVLSVQYLVLDRASEQLNALLLRVSHRYRAIPDSADPTSRPRVPLPEADSHVRSVAHEQTPPGSS